jgi:hypothetical protein
VMNGNSSRRQKNGNVSRWKLLLEDICVLACENIIRALEDFEFLAAVVMKCLIF